MKQEILNLLLWLRNSILSRSENMGTFNKKDSGLNLGSQKTFHAFSVGYILHMLEMSK